MACFYESLSNGQLNASYLNNYASTI